MKTVSLESKSYTFLIYIGIVIILYNIFVFANENSLFMADFYEMDINPLNVIAIILIFGSSIIAGIVAQKLNRSVLSWGILTLCFAPISLIVLGTKKLYLEPELQKVYNKYKSTYFLDKAKLKKNFESNKLNQEAYNKKLSELLNDLNREMNIELRETEKKIINDFDKDVIHKVEKTGNGKFVKVSDTCPACGAKLSETDFECPECGLNLK
jgi:hypothetical protein